MEQVIELFVLFVFMGQLSVIILLIQKMIDKAKDS